MILMKLGEEYKLYSHDSYIATTQESPHKRLSKQNCDEIFGVVDVEKLADEYLKDVNTKVHKDLERDGWLKIGYINGFNKAMELQKDKLFTVEDMVGYFDWHKKQGYVSHEPYDIHEYIQSLQEPTEIEVEIVMDDIWDGIDSARIFPKEETMIPQLDKNGCLILKKK